MSRANSPDLFMKESATRSTIVFDSDSETDSIKTDSTAKSEPRDEYEVERILLEESDQEYCYLVKWEGYKLFRSTWEPPESLVGGETLAEWERRKKRIAAGEVESFNYDDFMREFNEAEAEKKAKRQRRNAKRQKRGLPVKIYSSEEDGDGEDAKDGEVSDNETNDQSMANTSSKRQASPQESPKSTKKAKAPDVVRQGVAKKIRRTRFAPQSSSSDNDSSSHEAGSSSTDSFQEEPLARAARPKAKTQESARSRPDNAPSHKSASTAPFSKPASVPASGSASGPISQCPDTATVNKSGATTTVKGKAVTKVPHKAGPPGAARKSAPSHLAAAPTKKSHDVLANWDAPIQRREQQRVSGATPKDSTNPKFKALSVQSRYQKYGRENERAPDFSALTVMDPKTGKTIPPASNVQTEPAKQLPSVYHRRTPPPQERRRSPTPPSPDRTSALPRQSTDQAIDNATRKICKRWLTTGCTRAATDCDSIHPISTNDVSHFIDKKNITCWYWFVHGACNYGSGCDFVHLDTGIYPSPPNSGRGFFTVNLPTIDAQPPPPEPVTRPPPSALVTDQQRSRSTDGLAGLELKPPWQPACRDWLEGRCPQPAETCTWAHALPTEPYRGDINAIPKHQALCYYWSTRGTCTRGSSCAFSHVDTGVQAGPPGKGSSGRTSLVPKTSAREPLERVSIVSEGVADSRQNSSVSQADAIARSLPPHTLTCFFWRTRGGKCAKSDEECIYAHHNTGIWAAPPRGYDQTREDARWRNNANKTPLGASRSTSSTAQSPAFSSGDIGSETRSVQSPMELISSPIQTQAPPMPPPGRENSLRRQSVSTPAGSLATAITVSYSGDRASTLLQAKLELSELHVFGRLAGADPQLHVDRVVLASDFKTLVWDDQLRDSESTVGSIVMSDIVTGQSLVDLCKQNTVGLIAMQPGKKSRMLIYPPNNDVWKFLDAGSTWKTDSDLRFRLFSEIPGIEDLAPDTFPALENSLPKRHPAVLAGEELARLDAIRMHPTKDKLTYGARTVFLIFPPAHHVELEFYAKFFGGQNYRVYHSGVAGAWHYFRKTSDQKVVVVHPNVPLWQIPDLKQLLLTGMSIFSVGVNHLEPLEDPSFGCERLFPFATAVLITDDVFVYHPEKALEILNGFIRTMKGRLEYKIVMRPGVKEWLLRLAEDQTMDHGRQGNRWLRLYDATCRLCTPEDEDPYDRPNPSSDTNMVSLSPELLPDYDQLWMKDEAAATNFLVEWFAGWTMENVAKLRKLYVLYEPRGGFRSIMDSAGKWPVQDPSGWVKKYQHIWFQRPEDVFAAKK